MRVGGFGVARPKRDPGCPAAQRDRGSVSRTRDSNCTSNADLGRRVQAHVDPEPAAGIQGGDDTFVQEIARRMATMLADTRQVWSYFDALGFDPCHVW